MGTLKFLLQTCSKRVRAGRLAPAWTALVATTILVACVAQLAPAQAPAPATDKLTEILDRDVLIIATDADYAPQSKLKPNTVRAENTNCASHQFTANQLEGFDVQVAIEIAGQLGVEPCFTTPEWTLIPVGGWADRWDIHVGSMSITPDRMEVLYFTQPYYVSPAAFFVRQDNDRFSQVGDLSGKRVAVSSGTTYESYLKGSLVIPGQEIDFVVKNSMIEAYQADLPAIRALALENGSQLDAGLFAVPTGRNAIRQGAPLKQLGEPVFNEYLSVAIDKKHSTDPVSLVKKISEIIRQMHQNGTLLRLSEQFYELDLSTPASQFNVDSLSQFP